MVKMPLTDNMNASKLKQEEFWRWKNIEDKKEKKKCTSNSKIRVKFDWIILSENITFWFYVLFKYLHK